MSVGANDISRSIMTIFTKHKFLCKYCITNLHSVAVETSVY